ncbi:hypothetical protein Tco_1390124, partial [Tanacetum coccineum]
TYTAVSSLFGGLSDIRSSGVDGPPVMPEDPYAYVVAALQAPPSPDYVLGPEEPEQAPLSLEFVLEPVYPEFMPPKDEVFPAKEQPLPADHEEDPIDYPADVGDDDDDDDESSDNDEDDDAVEEEEDGEEEEEHPAPADSVPPLVHCVTAMMSIRDEPPTPFWSEAEIARLLAIPLPPPSPLSPWISLLSQIPSPPLPVSPPLLVSPPPLPASLTYPLRFKAAMIRCYTIYLYLSTRSETPPSGTLLLLHISLPTPSPPLLLPSTDHRVDSPEVCLPPRKRLCIALGPRYKVGESSSAPTTRPTGGFRADYGFVTTLDNEIRRDPERYVGYGITDTWDDMVEDMQGTPVATDIAGLSQRMTDFVTTVRQDIDEIYVRLDDA